MRLHSCLWHTCFPSSNSVNFVVGNLLLNTCPGHNPYLCGCTSLHWRSWFWHDMFVLLMKKEDVINKNNKGDERRGRRRWHVARKGNEMQVETSHKEKKKKMAKWPSLAGRLSNWKFHLSPYDMTREQFCPLILDYQYSVHNHLLNTWLSVFRILAQFIIGAYFECGSGSPLQ